MDEFFLWSLRNECSPVEGMAVESRDASYTLRFEGERLASQLGSNLISFAPMSQDAQRRLASLLEKWHAASKAKEDADHRAAVERRSALILSAIPPDIDSPSK